MLLLLTALELSLYRGYRTALLVTKFPTALGLQHKPLSWRSRSKHTTSGQAEDLGAGSSGLAAWYAGCRVSAPAEILHEQRVNAWIGCRSQIIMHEPSRRYLQNDHVVNTKSLRL
jgi:hypothetical protein